MSTNLKPCPVCKKGVMHEVFTATPLDHSLNKRFPILKCEYCGHGITDEALTTSPDLYNIGQYETNESFIHKLLRPILNLFETRKAKFVKKIARGNHLLEVGCGKGYFLLAAQKTGFQVSGIEPSARSRSFAQSNLTADISEKNLLDYVSVHNEHYDVVYLWHVLEHLDDLPKSLKAIRKILTENGALIFGVPNFSSLQAAYAGQYWYHLDPPRHINHFTPKSINEILLRHGFTEIAIFYNSYFQDFIGEIVSLSNRILPIKNLPINLLKRNPGTVKEIKSIRGAGCLCVFILATPLLLLFSTLNFILSHILKRPGTIIVVAR